MHAWTSVHIGLKYNDKTKNWELTYHDAYFHHGILPDLFSKSYSW